MKQPISNKKKNLILSVAMSSLIMLSIAVSSFAYWTKQEGNFNIPTTGFNATEDEFTYYACIPNVTAKHGYDYYDLDSIPSDLTDRITGLAVVRFEALTKTCYIPSYPKVTIDGVKYNSGEAKNLPVIHILNSLAYDDISIDNGYSKVETLIVPETIAFIQEGAFANSASLSEVSFLGTAENSGYIWFADTEFARLNAKDIHFEGKHRHDNTNLYVLINPENYLHTQFNDEFEYDNINASYYTFVVPKNAIAAGSEIIDGVVSTKAMNPNVKYRISYDGTTLNIDEYTYKLSYGGLDTPIDLVLNNSVNYEEYILPDTINEVSTLNTIRIANYPEISVDEYINGEINPSVVSTFELANLNASYSRDNNTFEIKYAPSYTYESTHYYTDSSDELVDVKTLTQISVEKAYFLNTVENSTLEVSGEKVKTITVPDQEYLSLYVRAKYTNKDNLLQSDEVYFVDPKKSVGDSTYIEMSKNGNSWTYQFSSNNAPAIVKEKYPIGSENYQYVVPTSFTFYVGEYSVVNYPSYTSNSATEQEIQSELASATYNTTRVYLDMAINDSSATAFYEDDHYGTDGEIKFHWYLVYWDAKGNKGSFRVYYADYDSTMLIADVPNIATKFKFARIAADSDIETATSGNWEGVVNQVENDLTFEDNFSESNCIKWVKWYDNGNGRFTYTNASNVTATGLLLRNKNYLVIDNYGEVGNQKYISLDENLGYGPKDIDGTINKLEFTKYSDYEKRHIQSVALPKDAVVKAKIFNINTAGYFEGYYGKSSVTGQNALGFIVQNSQGQDVNASEYFDFTQEGYLVVKKDCQVEFFIKVNYDKANKTISDYGWYIKVIEDKLPGFNREVIVDEERHFTGNNENYTSNTKTFDMVYPLLDQIGTPLKLSRNYSNTEFEEYYYHSFNSSNIDNRYFVISPYYESDRNFAANTGSIYYSIIGNSSVGEANVPNNYDLILFTPNEDGGYKERYYAVFDEFGNLLTYLSYNQTQSVNEGYQCFSFVIPQALNDYHSIYIYEVDENGDFIYEVNKDGEVIRDSKNEGPINSVTNLDQIRIMYNNTNNTNIQYSKNDLIYDYYLQIGDQYDYNTNNSGFSYAETDGEYDIYYFDDLLISNETTYRVHNTSAVNVQLNNVLNKLDEQIIDGYYYTNITLSNDYKKFTLPDGYYDLALRVNTSTNYAYIGYKYLGQEKPHEETYYLHLYEQGVEVDVITMNTTINTNNYFVDIVVSKDYTFDIYDSVNMHVTGSEGTLTYSNTGINVARIYFSNKYPYIVDEVATKCYVKQINGIELIYNFGNHPNKYNEEYVNIRYSPVMYVPTGESFVEKIQVKDITNPYLYVLDEKGAVAETYYFETRTEVRYGTYIVINDFNVDIQIKIGKTEIERTIPQPGKYYVYYYKGTGVSPAVVTITKVQVTDRFSVTLNGEEIAILDVSPDSLTYYEYVVKNHIILYEEIVLTGNEADILQVEDYLGNVASSIDRVTLNGTSVTTIPAGVYSLTYSVDSSRRVDDKYLVFTYFNFTSIPNSTITYHYETSVGVSKTTEKLAVTTTNEITWNYTLELYKTFSSYTPQGKYFAGWTLTEGSKTVDYTDGKVINVTEDIDLYPVFKDRSENHPVIWLSDLIFDSTSNIIFTLGGLETSTITDVTHQTVDTSNYINVVDNRVYVNPSLFERIGYIDGGIPLLVHLESTIDGAEYSTEIFVPYPRYENGTESNTMFSTTFSSADYPINNAEQAYTKTIKGLNDSVISWDVEDANMTTYLSKDGGEDMALRIKAGASGSIIGKATTDILFTDIATVTFDMYTSNYYEETSLYVVLLDASRRELYRSEPLSNTVDGSYEPMSVSVNVDGVYFVRFEAKTIKNNYTFVHIDNVSLMGKIIKVTVDTDISDYATENEWANATKYTTINLDENVTITANGGSNTGKYYTNGNDWRIYQSENGTITITAAKGYSLVSIKVNYTVENGGVLTYNDNPITSGTIVLTPAHSIKCVVENTEDANNGVVKITSIEVIYETSENSCVFNQEVATENYLATEATCQEVATYYYSCACGEKGDTTFEYGELAEHNLSTGYRYDEDNHWKFCITNGCDYEGEEEQHSGGLATLDEEARCETCEQKYGEKQATVSVNIGSYATANGWEDDKNEKSTIINMDSNITVTSSSGIYTGKYFTNGNVWGIYQTDGGKFTITASKGYDLVSVKITYTIANAGTLTLGGENVASGTIVEIPVHSATFVVGNSGIATNGQVKITSIEVVYKANPNSCTYIQEVATEDYLVSDATCQNRAVYYKSCVCGAIGNTTFEYGELAPHNLSEDYDYNETSHWKVCTTIGCDHKGELGEHSGGSATLDERATCTTCNQEYGEKYATVSVNIGSYATANNWQNDNQSTTILMDSIITVSSSGKTETGKYFTNGTNWRIYQSDNGTFTIKAGEGYALISVKVTYTIANTGILMLVDKQVASGEEVATPYHYVTFGVGNTGSATNGQVRITSIEVKYKESQNSCIFDQTVVDAKHLASPATCQNKATYYYSCLCEANGNTTFEYGDLGPHIGEDTCTVCGEALNVVHTATAQYPGGTTMNMSTGSNNASLIGLDPEVFNVTTNKDNAKDQVGLNQAGQIRLYAHSDTGLGCELIITATNKTISKISITLGGTVGSFSVNGNTSEQLKNTTQEYEINAESVTIKNITQGSTTQVYILKIVILYS